MFPLFTIFEFWSCFKVPLFISLRNIETHKINNMILTSRVICERIIEENLQAQLFVSSDKGTSTQTFQGIFICEDRMAM
jgi:hypothetical protein